MSAIEGVKLFYEQYLSGPLGKYNSHKWRRERYWNEECDTVVKNNVETLRDIFNFWALHPLPGEPKTFRYARLIELITTTDVFDDNFGERETGLCFNLSM